MHKQNKFPFDYLSDARAEYFELLDGGANCPCCGRYGKRNKIRLGYGPAKILVWFYKNREKGWIHLPSIGNRFILTSNQAGRLKKWGLVKRQSNSNPKKNKSGTYRITKRGIDFVEKKIKVPESCKTYNNRVLSFSDTLIGIDEALTVKFNYAEIMADRN